MRDSRKTYLICAAVILTAAICISWGRGLFSAPDLPSAFGALSDGFFVPGAAMIGVSGLRYAASKGAYDAFGYAFSRFSLHSLFTTRQTYREPESLYEYKRQRREQARPWSPVTLYSGLAGLALSGLCLLLYAVL